MSEGFPAQGQQKSATEVCRVKSSQVDMLSHMQALENESRGREEGKKLSICHRVTGRVDSTPGKPACPCPHVHASATAHGCELHGRKLTPHLAPMPPPIPRCREKASPRGQDIIARRMATCQVQTHLSGAKLLPIAPQSAPIDPCTMKRPFSGGKDQLPPTPVPLFTSSFAPAAQIL